MFTITNNEDGTRTLKFSYSIPDLKEEIKKRTSYLGKFRRTEETHHLLDLISMTNDESDLFDSYSKSAMADVFDALHKFSLSIRKEYIWETTQTTESIVYKLIVPACIDLTNVSPLDTAISEAIVNNIIFHWLLLSYPDEADVYSKQFAQNISAIRVRCNIFNVPVSRIPRIF